MFFLIVILYFATRLYHLSLLPIFFDESLYVYWAKIIAATHHQLFISLTDGKSPLPVWLMAAAIALFPPDLYLTAGRFPSTLAGFLTLIAVYKLTSLLFSSHRTALIASFLYIISPFSLTYDRMALYDSYLTTALTWALYFLFRKSYLFWGLAEGFALLSKASAVLNWLLFPAIFLINAKNWRRYLLPLLAVSIIAQIVHQSLIVSRGYYEYLAKSLYFTPSRQSLLAHPLDPLLPNLVQSFHWLVAYQTPLMLLLSVTSLLYLIYRHRRLGVSFLILLIVPILTFSFLGRVFFPRYLLFLVPYFIIPTAYALRKFPALLIVAVVPQLIFDYNILINPANAPFPALDRYQYVSGFPSGYGLEPIFNRIDAELARGPVNLVVEGSYSHYPNAFLLRYWGNPKIKIYERWPLTTLDPEIYQLAKDARLLIVLRVDNGTAKKDSLGTFPLKVIFESRKPGGKDPVFLTELDKSAIPSQMSPPFAP